MDHSDYPALFRSADTASSRYQKNYLSLIAVEYALLVVASVFSLSGLASKSTYIAATLILIVSAGVLLFRAIAQPEQDWYRSRALAESVKTLTWRYAMGAHPFHDLDGAVARREFKENLERTFQNNREAASKVAEDWADGSQITPKMEQLRIMPVVERKAIYDEHRIQSQRTWYSQKAGWNRRMSRRWVVAGVLAYLFAAAFSLMRIGYS